MERRQYKSKIKIGIMTFISALNYGASLQVFALQRVLDELGYDVSVINYSSPYLDWVYAPIKREFHPKNFKQYMRLLIMAIYYRKKNCIFNNFLSENLKLTKKYYTGKQLKELNDLFDIFISGSDQVFNDECSNMDTAYFLSFIEDSKKKYTYAASFGFDKIPCSYIYLYKELLKDFNNFSVREESAKNIIYDLLNRNAIVHPDPTILFSKEDWANFFDLSTIPCRKPYILVYSVKPYIDLMKAAEALSKKTKLKIVIMDFDVWSYIRRLKGQKIKPIFRAGPVEFLSYIDNAEYVLTNSFHATAFATIFHTPFLSEIETMDGRNTRSEEFLRKTGMLDRVLIYHNILSIKDPVNWKETDYILQNEREKTKNYLQHAMLKDHHSFEEINTQNNV